MPRFQYFPKYTRLPGRLEPVVACFIECMDSVSSATHTLASDEVLRVLTPHLQSAGFLVETGKCRTDSIPVPVLFGENGEPEKSFNCDALSSDGRVVMEVEAGRAYTNYQFLKDLFQASMMADVEFLVLAVRLVYRGHNDYDKIRVFFETMYASNRIELSLNGVLLIGY